MTTKRQLFAQLGCLYANEAEAMRWFGEVGRYRLEQAHELQLRGGKPMSTPADRREADRLRGVADHCFARARSLGLTDTSTDGIFWKDDNG